MTVAVVFIGTEKYLDFLPSWYERCEENFLPGVEKKYLVFTDGDVPEAPDNAIVYKQEHLEWPYITLYRFKIIEKALEEKALLDKIGNTQLSLVELLDLDKNAREFTKNI